MPRTPPCRDFFSILPPQAPIPLICKSMSPPLMYIGDPQLFVWSCLLVLMTTTCKTQQISWWSLLGNAELLHEAPGCFFEGPSTQSWGSNSAVWLGFVRMRLGCPVPPVLPICLLEKLQVAAQCTAVSWKHGCPFRCSWEVGEATSVFVSDTGKNLVLSRERPWGH